MKPIFVTCLTVLLLSIPDFVFGQSNKDSKSLEVLLENPDTTTVIELLRVSREIRVDDLDSSKILVESAIRLSKSLKYDEGLGDSYNKMGITFQYLGNVDSAIFYYEIGCKVRREIADSVGILTSLRALGSINSYKGRFTKAIEYYNESLSIAHAISNDYGISAALNNMGTVYYRQKNYDKALDYYQRTLEMEEKMGDPKEIASTLGNIGMCHNSLGEKYEALQYNLKSFNILDSLGEKCRLAYPAINTGALYSELEEYDDALVYLELAHKLSEECNIYEGITSTLVNIAIIHRAKREYSLAEKALTKAYENALEQELKNPTLDAVEEFYLLYKAIGDDSKALKYLEIAGEMKDEMFNEDLTEQLTKMELDYTFRKEKDSIEFKKQSELIELSSSLEKQQLFRNLFVGGLVATLILIFILYRNYRLKNIANNHLRRINTVQKEKLTVEETLRKQLEVENNQKARNLTANSIQLLNFNEKLEQAIDKIQGNSEIEEYQKNIVVKELSRLQNSDNQWDNMKTHFENVHPDFFNNLEQHFPNLSANDHKLLAFMKMKLSNKEIAVILNVTKRAVEQSKRRIKKKLGMDTEENDILLYLNKQYEEKGV